MIKIKHARTADCVVAGFRWHKTGKDDARRLAAARPLRRPRPPASRRRHVVVHDGEAAGSSRASSRRCATRAMDEHPWREWAEAGGAEMTRMPGGQSRWSAGKDLSWEPLRIERVCEVKYDHMQGDRFRHAAVFLRWRPDKQPATAATISSRSRPAYELETGLRRAGSAVADALPVVGQVLVGIERLLARTSSAGTCCRLTRMRVQVWKRPRIASTSTSAGCRCAAASGWRAFQRSRPASASAFSRARGRSRSADAPARAPP